jgi:hypothetical protein
MATASINGLLTEAVILRMPASGYKCSPQPSFPPRAPPFTLMGLEL